MEVAALLGLPASCVGCTWPVAVIGAGPAGAFLALHLARAGVEVLLIDRASFPRWKVCGCCLSGAALETLRSVGLGELVENGGGVPLSQVCLGVAGRSALVPAG